MCFQYMEGNSFLQLSVNFQSNRWSSFRDFMFTVLENVVSREIAFEVGQRYATGSYTFYCNSFTFWNFGAELRLKYVDKM